MNYQFIVISIDSERKQHMLRQFVDAGISEQCVTFISPATIENQKHWFPTGTPDLIKARLCCAQSHLFSLEFASLSSSPDYSIVLEDDVAFHKTQFKNTIEEIIERWDEIVAPSKLVSIGWVPIATRESFARTPIRNRLYSINGASILNCCCSGTQGYIVRKSDIRPIIKDLIQPTFADLKAHVDTLTPTHPRIKAFPIDELLPFLLNQCIVYPPLIVEQPFESHLKHSNWSMYWEAFYAPPYHRQIDDYNMTFKQRA